MKPTGHGESKVSSRWCMLHGTPVPVSSGQGFECLQGPWDPKGGELYHSTAKPWETVVEAGPLF